MHRPIGPEGRSARRLAPAGEASCPVSSRPFVLAATITASAMAFIDSTVVNIALPAIQQDLGAGITDLQWVINAYLLMLGAFILIGGGLGDRLGRRRIFVIGIIAFTSASVLCALAPSSGVLIAARAAQGAGAALLVPQSLAIISASFPADIRGRAIGTWAAASAITTALGPVVGGMLIDTLSWRVAFWINLPLAALALWLSLVHIPESRDPAAAGPVDWYGAATAAAAFALLTFGLTSLAEGIAVLPAVTVVLGVVGVAGFVAVEQRAANPVMPTVLFRSWTFTGTNIVTVFLYGALSGVFFLLPFDLLARRGYSAAEAGLLLLPVGLIIGFASRWMGSLADARGPRTFLVVGPLVFALACVGFASGIDDLWLGVVIPIVLIAVGMAIVVSPLTTAVMNAVPDRRSGAASGINNAASRLAGVFAVAIFGAVGKLVYDMLAPDGAPRFGVLPDADAALRAEAEQAFLAAYAGGMILAAAWALAAALAAYLTIPKGKPPVIAAEDGADRPDGA